MTRYSFALAVAVLLTGACDTVANICDTDPYGCSQETGNFLSITEGCPSEPLTVDVGYGQGEFIAFEPQQDLPVEFGPQGGSHAWLGVLAKGVAIDVTGKLKTFLRVWVENVPGCMRESQDDESPECRSLLSSRNVLLGDGKRLNVLENMDETRAEQRLVDVSETGLIIFSAPIGDSGSIEATIEDECGRIAKAIHWVGNAGPNRNSN
jgi:hypothetical protein